MKIVTIVGARPQFIKAAAGSRQLRNEHQEILVHTGQHCDANMSDVFFSEMGIPTPDYNLGISGGTHSQMTARMLIEVEHVLLAEKPDAVLVYGDTNTTLAGALAAVKLLIPVLHAEAGNRLGTLQNPEEINRVLTDHSATLNFCASKDCLRRLEAENLGHTAHVVGNIMYDSFRYFANQPWVEQPLEGLDGDQVTIPRTYYYMTCHRQENTDDDTKLLEILSAMDNLDAPTVYPVHPRNLSSVQRLSRQKPFRHILFIKPVSYGTSQHLLRHAKKVVTDSGGLQCEAFFAGVQCVCVFQHVVWPETMVENRNQLAEPKRTDILNKLGKSQNIDPSYQPFGDGHAAEKICEILRDWSQ